MVKLYFDGSFGGYYFFKGMDIFNNIRIFLFEIKFINFKIKYNQFFYFKVGDD